MRVAIVHDYLTQSGGAERVVEAMHEIWPDAPIYTSIYDPNTTFPSFRKMDVRTTFLQRMVKIPRMHKYVLALYPTAFEHLDMSGYDVVLSSSSSFAKGIITSPDTCHICYCHTPPRFAWRYHEYISHGKYSKAVRRTLPFIVNYLRNWDYSCAQRVDYFISNSFNVARRVQKFYGRDSDVIYPPVQTNRFQRLENPTADYLLVVSRLIGYKKVDLAVQACTQLGLPLKVVGIGEEMPRLKAMAGPTVQFMGRLSDAETVEQFTNCRAFLFPGEEDLGIAPIEAMASGRPVVAYRAGGALETILEGKTGIFFDEPTVDSLAAALQRLGGCGFDSSAIRSHAETFDVGVFQDQLLHLVESNVAEYRLRYGRIRPGIDPRETIHLDAHGKNGNSNIHSNAPSKVRQVQ